MARPAFPDREKSPRGFSLMDTVLGICVPLGCGILVGFFVLLVNQ